MIIKWKWIQSTKSFVVLLIVFIELIKTVHQHIMNILSLNSILPQMHFYDKTNVMNFQIWVPWPGIWWIEVDCLYPISEMVICLHWSCYCFLFDIEGVVTQQSGFGGASYAKTPGETFLYNIWFLCWFLFLNICLICLYDIDFQFFYMAWFYLYYISVHDVKILQKINYIISVLCCFSAEVLLVI